MSTNPIASKAPTVTIAGRLSSVEAWPRKNPTRYTVLVRLPAPDEFTTPATVEVVSDINPGNEGDLVTLVCRVGGRYRSYTATDKATGEQRTVRTADNVLTVA